MPTRRFALSLAAAGVVVVAGSLGGCQSASSTWSSKSQSRSSSFNVAMAAVSEADFAQQHQFYYFPNAQIYRDCDEDRWLWSEDGGFTWSSGPTLPEQFQPGDEIPFAVFLSHNNPAPEHQAIAAAYPRDDSSAPAMAAAQSTADHDD